MPRDANGNYTLPAGNPVVSGTPISSSTHNLTNSDIAQALSDSLSRTGLGGMQAPLEFGDGLVGSPSITFVNEPTTGIYRPGNGEWAVTILGVKIFEVRDLGVYAEQPFWEWRAGSADYVRLLNAFDNYTIAGDWTFTVNANRGPQIAAAGGMIYHELAAEYSGVVRIVAVAPGPADGLPGDIWLVV
jgi:hypothetical protein